MEISGRAPLSTRFFMVLLIMIVSHETIDAKKNKHHCPPSSCGNLHNISHPFRLSTDPQNCGESGYELSCENNYTVLNLQMEVSYLVPEESQRNGKYYYKSYVQAIYYNNYTIRIADPDLQKENCSSIPFHSLSKEKIRLGDQFEAETRFKPVKERGGNRSEESMNVYQLVETIVFLTCEKPIKKSHIYNHIDRYPCTNNDSDLSQSKTQHSYVVVGGNLRFSDLDESCCIDQVSVISTRRGLENLTKTTSYRDIHDELVYGFELSWLPSFGNDHVLSRCYVKEDSNEVDCEAPSIVYPWKLLIFRYIGTLIFGARLYCIIIVIILLIYKCCTRHLSMDDSIEEFLQSHINLMPIRYCYWEIKEMSNSFKVKLGEGGFGSVYKGKLSNGRLVAIKMGKSKASGQDFINEVATIGRIHHVNVVQLIGFCVEGSKRALVFDFMPNGSLDKYIFSKEGIRNRLSYKEIYKISLGVARGIQYLHQGCDMRILHFDIKPHNILLDENFVPKVSDFGLARFSTLDDSAMSLTAARGTIGYIAPEQFYRNLGGISYRADVYSFGMLLMEMANKRKNLNANAENSSQIYFPLWIYDQFRKGKDMEIEDATEEESETVKKMIIVALWCIQLKPCDRPSMNKVTEMLEGKVESLEMPPKPYLFPQEQEEERHNDAGETSSSSTTLSE